MRQAWLLVIAAGIALPAAAQTVPEGQSCGGLLCDMGMFGHRTAPQAAAPSTPVPAPAATGERKTGGGRLGEGAEAKHAARKPRRVAKAPEGAPEARPGPSIAAPSLATPSISAASTPAPPVPVASPPAQVAAAPKAPAAPEIFVPMTPYASSQPARVLLTPIVPGN